MTITVSRLTPSLGAIIEGVTLADELPQQSVDRLGELLVEHHLLFFRGQPITPQQECRFAARFGELHIHPIYPVLPELPEINEGFTTRIHELEPRESDALLTFLFSHAGRSLQARRAYS
jgi:alpha-ketoglutarate-dependent taurine dioxygenase